MKQNSFGTIIEIGDILVSEEVILEYFACDYAVCKGKCCIIGDSGAPLKEEELEPLEANYEVPGSEECAFCHFEDGSCFCSIERQFGKGLSSFKKPISCSLYPIRVVDLGGGRCGLNLHRWDICKEAYEKGRREGIRVYEFLRGPLTDAFGEEFYSALSAAAKMLIAAS